MTDLSSLSREVKLRSGTYTFVRPGISLRLSYSQPIQSLGPRIAEAIELFVEFIKPATLDTYQATSGWKATRGNTLSRDLRELRAIPSTYEAVGYHYGQGHPGSVGDYGLYFQGRARPEDIFPLQESVLILDFPLEFLERKRPEEFVEFAATVAGLSEFGSGCAGFSFKHFQLTNRARAYDAIGSMAMRYIGFDINSDSARYSSGEHLYNTSWLTLVGNVLVERLGGMGYLRGAASDFLGVHQLSTGALLRASELPIVGDVNVGAADAEPLKRLAPLVRSIRQRPPVFGLGPEDPDFANAWLSRFDSSTE